ncbi:phenylalanine racemase [Niallia taxi]|uniref:phenylalanine racemase n=1 Tax=Niallia taxi TaxID=2499688 RepID=UPI003744381F
MAFFVVRIGISRSEFDQLTETEKLFIRKEHENKFIHDTTWMRNAMLNAEANANRKKGSKFLELFRKKAHKVDKDYNENAVNAILDVESKKGKSWVDKIFKANNIKKGGK